MNENNNKDQGRNQWYRKQWPKNSIKTKLGPFKKLMRENEKEDTNYEYQQWVISLILAWKI